MGFYFFCFWIVLVFLPILALCSHNVWFYIKKYNIHFDGNHSILWSKIIKEIAFITFNVYFYVKMWGFWLLMKSFWRCLLHFKVGYYFYKIWQYILFIYTYNISLVENDFFVCVVVFCNCWKLILFIWKFSLNV